MTPTSASTRSRPAFSIALLQAFVAVGLCGSLLGTPVAAQDRLRTMPGFDRYEEMRTQIPGSFVSGALRVTWADDGSGFEYVRAGRSYRFDLARGEAVDLGEAPAGNGDRRRGPARGRQFDSADSPDGTMKALYRDQNLFISAPDGSAEMAVTTEGSAEKRIKYGSASWVYGEELRQNTAMWWSPDGSKLAYYRFDESPVPDYFLQTDQTQIQSALDVEAYPKAGVDNPLVDLFVYDVASGISTRIDVRDGQAFTNDVVGHYACRVIVREEWPDSWVQNSPAMQYLEDGECFIWTSERTGWRNLYLYDLSGELLATLTDHAYEVANVVRVDEQAGEVYYMARDGDNHMMLQLHRVGLDGTGEVRLTDPAFNHQVAVAPDGSHFVDVAQTHDEAPVTYLRDSQGREVAELARSDLSGFGELGLERVEMFTFTAADGETELHGMLHKPSNFDPSRKYPVLVSVYAGPGSNGAREQFTVPNPLTEYGFLVVSMDSRSASGRGKRFMDAIYLKLGVVEVDDQAAGVRSLWDRPYVAQDRVGIFGTSYGGTSSAMGLLRHPDVFQAASASSAVTDWRHYDTIYTERYMWIPQENEEGYDAGSAMTHVDSLQGRLMLYYGTADNNVHPSNTMQLIEALQRAGKSFEVQVGPDRGHSGVNRDRMMEFFIENLVIREAG